MSALYVLTLVCGYLICVLIGVLGFLVLREIYTGRIDLSRLISEPTGDASMSRFQFLVFTFVIAFSLFLVVVATLSGGTPSGGPRFPDIPATVLTLLGISGSSYLVSKGIQFSDPAGIADRSTDTMITIAPKKAVVRYEQTQQFSAEVAGEPNPTLKWQVIAGEGSIDNKGLYTAPKRPVLVPPPAPAAAPDGTVAAPAVAPLLAHATIQVTCDEYPEVYDLAVLTLS
jgi:hypothetical protein